MQVTVNIILDICY